MSTDTIIEIGFFLVLGVPLLIAYIMPTIIAVRRNASGLGVIVFLNVFLGWSMVAWAMAMAMAVQNDPS